MKNKPNNGGLDWLNELRKFHPILKSILDAVIGANIRHFEKKLHCLPSSGHLLSCFIVCLICWASGDRVSYECFFLVNIAGISQTNSCYLKSVCKVRHLFWDKSHLQNSCNYFINIDENLSSEYEVVWLSLLLQRYWKKKGKKYKKKHSRCIVYIFVFVATHSVWKCTMQTIFPLYLFSPSFRGTLKSDCLCQQECKTICLVMALYVMEPFYRFRVYNMPILNLTCWFSFTDGWQSLFVEDKWGFHGRMEVCVNTLQGSWPVLFAWLCVTHLIVIEMFPIGSQKLLYTVFFQLTLFYLFPFERERGKYFPPWVRCSEEFYSVLNIAKFS